MSNIVEVASMLVSQQRLLLHQVLQRSRWLLRRTKWCSLHFIGNFCDVGNTVGTPNMRYIYGHTYAKLLYLCYHMIPASLVTLSASSSGRGGFYTIMALYYYQFFSLSSSLLYNYYFIDYYNYYIIFFFLSVL